MINLFSFFPSPRRIGIATSSYPPAGARKHLAKKKGAQARHAIDLCYLQPSMSRLFSQLQPSVLIAFFGVSLLGLTACGSPPPQAATPPPAQPPAPPVVLEPVAPPPKPKITRLDDLPRHTYPVTGTVLGLVNSDVEFNGLAEKVRADLTHDLATYEIDDRTTLKSLKGTLLTLDLLQGQDAAARALIAEVRGLEDKPAAKLLSGLLAEVRLDVIQQTGSRDYASPAFQAAYQAELARRVAALPWAVVGDSLKSTRASFETESPNLITGLIESSIEPAVQKTGSLSFDLASEIIGLRSVLQISLKVRPAVLATLGPVIAANSKLKPDIWKSRSVTFTRKDHLTPVVIAIWDSGVDPKVYPHQLFTDAGAPKDKGDPHGLAFDLHSNRVHGALMPLGVNAKRYPELKAQIKGEEDLSSAIESPEAVALRQKMAQLKPEQVKPFFEDLDMVADYAHGTHVAGIASSGNPAARLLIARITFDYHLIPEKPTLEQTLKDAAAYPIVIDYFKQHHVRVVNMSWGGSLKDVEDALEKNGVGDAAERKKEARQYFEIDRNALYAALQSAPDILFVAAAGNSNNDVAFDEMIPSSFQLPNLITVGAVDQAGDETSFTSFGNNVFAYADGFEVESYIPGGTKLKLSGTSMASPEVANLAAKLFALDPKLTPSAVINLIRDHLDVAPQDPRIHLINPKTTLEAISPEAPTPAPAPAHT